MLKKVVLTIFNIIEYVALCVATGAVLVSQFVSPYVFVLIGLYGYCIGFFFSGVKSVLSCVEIFSASKQVNEEYSALVVTNNVEVLNSKTEKRRAVFGAIVWLCLFAFALVVLIMYPRGA